MIKCHYNLSVCEACSPFPLFSPVSNEPIGFGPEQTFSKEVDDKANAYFQVSISALALESVT